VGKKPKKWTEADVEAGGGRFIRAFVLGSERDAATGHDAAAQNNAAGVNSAAAQNDATGENGAAADDGKPMSGAERTKKYRDTLKDSQRKQQLYLMTTVDPEKRATLKELAQAIEIDGVHSVCAMAVRAKDDTKTLDGMRVAGDAPDVLTLGVVASHVDVRPVVDGVIEYPVVRNVAAACLADRDTCGHVAAILRNPATLQFFAAVADNAELRACLDAMLSDPAFLGLCSFVRQDTQMRHAAQAAQATPKIAAIAVQLANGTFWKIWRPRSNVQRSSSLEDGRQSHRRFDARWSLRSRVRTRQNSAIRSCRSRECEPRSH
jgi:hypothetical protein